MPRGTAERLDGGQLRQGATGASKGDPKIAEAGGGVAPHKR